jgi:AraC-like DNA-binding protein
MKGAACEILDHDYFSRQYVFLQPCAPLRELVSCYWTLDLRKAGEEQGGDFRELLLANVHSSLVFNLGNEFEIHTSDGQLLHQCKKSVIISYHDQPVLYRHLRGNFLVGMKFRPGALSLLSGTPSTSLLRELRPMESIFKDARELDEKLYAAKDQKSVCEVLDEALLKRLQTLDPGQEQFKVLRALNDETRGGYQMKQLASMLYVSPRTLERYFSGSFGIAPKKCLRILRFRRAVEEYRRCGYHAAKTGGPSASPRSTVHS